MGGPVEGIFLLAAPVASQDVTVRAELTYLSCQPGRKVLKLVLQIFQAFQCGLVDRDYRGFC